MRLQHVLFLLAVSLTLPGCAMREPLTPAVSEPESVPLAVSFTEQVAAFPEGATQYFAESPFGPVTIEAGAFYISGLNFCEWNYHSIYILSQCYVYIFN